jgi:RimJ/RimL family protein N-acetyltransferase
MGDYSGGMEGASAKGMKETVFTSLKSQRLRLRRFLEADLPPFLAYLNDPLVARYQTWESYTE